jgi:voltage-gated potassium channel
MVYFSFITLIAIGYGDITPTGDVGQMFSVMEGLIGQFYLAILVARIVSVFALRASRSKEKS